MEELTQHTGKEKFGVNQPKNSNCKKLFRTFKNLLKNIRAIFHVMHVFVKKVSTLKNLKTQG